MVARFSRAFTLIEMLITMIVISLLAAFAVPTYQLILSQLQLNAGVEQAVDFVRLAAQKTVTEQDIFGVTFTAGSPIITMFEQTDPSTQVTVDTLTLPTNIVISTYSFGGANQVRFSTAGAPNVSGSFTVRDVIRNRSRLVEIRPSGNIRANQSEQ